MGGDRLTYYQQFHHDSKWIGLNDRLVFEAPTELVRRILRETKPRKFDRFIIPQLELRRALGLKV